VAVNTALAGGTGAVSGLMTNLYLEERRTGEYTFNLTMAMNGCLSGLVAITAPCGTVYNWAAVVIGMVAAWIYIGASKLLIRLRIDDAVDAIPVHLCVRLPSFPRNCRAFFSNISFIVRAHRSIAHIFALKAGSWGVISVGLFSAPRLLLEAFGTDAHIGLLYSIGQSNVDFTLLATQFLELLFIVGWSTANMLPFFIFLNYMGWFRVDSLEETVGLDTSYHRSGAIDLDGDDEVKESDVVALMTKRASSSAKRRGMGPREDQDDDKSWSELTINQRQAPGQSVAAVSVSNGDDAQVGE
jgi:ammonium transporter, Amt family